jgi:hypothetical protein
MDLLVRSSVLAGSALLTALLAACPTAASTGPGGSGTAVDGGTNGPDHGTCAEPIPRVLTAQPGLQQGFVVDACGTPVDGVRVITRNAFANPTDAPLTTRPNNGFYSQAIPEASVWETWAEIDRDFDGDRYCITAFPETTDTFAARGGAVRNMIWRLDGERPGSTAGNRHYNGGRLIVDANRILGANIRGTTDSVLTFVFRPIGPLVDGTTPPDFARPIAFRDLGTYDGPPVNGVPLGKYELIVAIRFPNDPTNYQVYTRITTLAQPFAASVVAKFSDGGKGSGPISCLATPHLDLELALAPGT